MKRRPQFWWWYRTSYKCWSTKAIMQPYFLPTIKCFKTMKMSLNKNRSLAYFCQNKEPQNFSDPVGHYCNSNYRNNWNPTATILLILTLSPALTFSLHMQINVPGKSPSELLVRLHQLSFPFPPRNITYMWRERERWVRKAFKCLVCNKTQLMHSSMWMKLLLADPNRGKWFIPREHWKVSIKSVANKK